MTADAWTSGTDWQAMLLSLPAPVDRRKLRLWSVAWARDILDNSTSPEFDHVRGWYSPAAVGEYQRELDAAEQYADGAIDRAALHAAKARSGGPWNPFHIPSGMTRLNPDTIRSVLSQFAREFRVPTDPTLSGLLRCVFGNPSRPVAADPRWLTPTVTGLASAIYEDRAYDRLPVLADALAEADCADEAILAHCRSGGPHVRGCFVVDLLLGRA